MKIKLLVFLFLVCCFVGFVVEKSYALSLVYLTSSVSSGAETMYSFTLNNEDTTLVNIFELNIQMPVDEGDLVDFSSPDGWGDGFDGPPDHGAIPPDKSYVEWWSEDIMGSELPSLSSLPGFSITTSNGDLLEDILFSVTTDAGVTDFLPAEFQPSQVIVPEPSTFLMCALGLLLGARQKRYKKKA